MHYGNSTGHLEFWNALIKRMYCCYESLYSEVILTVSVKIFCISIV